MKGRFYIEGTKGHPVSDVGCRVKVARLLLESPDVKSAMVRNIEPNKVEVIVEMETEDQIKQLRDVIQKIELPNIPTNPGFTVTSPDYSKAVQEINLPSIDRFSNSLTLEQLDKAVGAFLGVKSTTEDMNAGIRSLKETIVKLPKEIAHELAAILGKK